MVVVDGSPDASTKKYLITTSKQPICVLDKNKWINARALPFRYAGVSTCFRKEAGPRSGMRELHLSPEKDLELEGE